MPGELGFSEDRQTILTPMFVICYGGIATLESLLVRYWSWLTSTCGEYKHVDVDTPDVQALFFILGVSLSATLGLGGQIIPALINKLRGKPVEPGSNLKSYELPWFFITITSFLLFGMSFAIAPRYSVDGAYCDQGGCPPMHFTDAFVSRGYLLSVYATCLNMPSTTHYYGITPTSCAANLRFTNLTYYNETNGITSSYEAMCAAFVSPLATAPVGDLIVNNWFIIGLLLITYLHLHFVKSYVRSQANGSWVRDLRHLRLEQPSTYQNAITALNAPVGHFKRSLRFVYNYREQILHVLTIAVITNSTMAQNGPWLLLLSSLAFALCGSLSAHHARGKNIITSFLQTLKYGCSGMALFLQLVPGAKLRANNNLLVTGPILQSAACFSVAVLVVIGTSFIEDPNYKDLFMRSSYALMLSPVSTALSLCGLRCAPVNLFRDVARECEDYRFFRHRRDPLPPVFSPHGGELELRETARGGK